MKDKTNKQDRPMIDTSSKGDLIVDKNYALSSTQHLIRFKKTKQKVIVSI
jgi:hypothetical protein